MAKPLSMMPSSHH